MGGWYPSLFPTPLNAIDWIPTIADVHTQPTDEVGNPVGKVLHAGVGNVNLAAFVVKGHDGVARAYLGPVFSYYEVTESNFKRLNDEEWMKRLGNPGSPVFGGSRAVPAPPVRPPWAQALVGN